MAARGPTRARQLGIGPSWQTRWVILPMEPPPSPWELPCSARAQAEAARGGEVVGIGADLEPGTLLAGYRCGVFPMPMGARLAWWSPEERGVIPLDALVISKSLRRSCRRFEVKIDAAFEEVVEGCADPSRPGSWINRRVKDAYLRLHEMGWAHSVEAWSPSGLAGGLYGVAVGGLFAGESMFHRQTDASKVALVALVDAMTTGGGSLLDVQWVTPHLAGLGAVAVSRERYHELLADAVGRPQVDLAAAWARATS